MSISQIRELRSDMRKRLLSERLSVHGFGISLCEPFGQCRYPAFEKSYLFDDFHFPRLLCVLLHMSHIRLFKIMHSLNTLCQRSTLDLELNIIVRLVSKVVDRAQSV